MHAQGGEASGSLSNAPLHMADMGTDNFEQEMSFSLLENEQQTLEEVNDALDRIKAGSFGLCEDCQKPIPRPRLQALPYARFCVDCARKEERGT
jgi:RNA polymerase-binding transcription factor DksA